MTSGDRNLLTTRSKRSEVIINPSSLKKMRGSRGGKEGKYASLDTRSSLNAITSNDLGLTLLPGSQTEQRDEDRIRSTNDGGSGAIHNANSQVDEQIQTLKAERSRETALERPTLSQATYERKYSGHTGILEYIADAGSFSVNGEYVPRRINFDTEDVDGSGLPIDVWLERARTSPPDDESCANEPRTDQKFPPPKKRRMVGGGAQNSSLDPVVSIQYEERSEHALHGKIAIVARNQAVVPKHACRTSDQDSDPCGESQAEHVIFPELSVQASSGVVLSDLMLSKPGIEVECAGFSPRPSQQADYPRNPDCFTAQSNYPILARPVPNDAFPTARALWSTIEPPIEPPIEFRRTATPTPPASQHLENRAGVTRLLKSPRFSSASRSNFHRQVLKAGKHMNRSWTSHYPTRPRVPPLPSHASLLRHSSSATPSITIFTHQDTYSSTDSPTANAFYESTSNVNPYLLPASFDTSKLQFSEVDLALKTCNSDDSVHASLFEPPVKSYHSRSISLPKLCSLHSSRAMDLSTPQGPKELPTPPSGISLFGENMSFTSPSSGEDALYSDNQDPGHSVNNDFGSHSTLIGEDDFQLQHMRAYAFQHNRFFADATLEASAPSQSSNHATPHELSHPHPVGHYAQTNNDSKNTAVQSQPPGSDQQQLFTREEVGKLKVRWEQTVVEHVNNVQRAWDQRLSALNSNIQLLQHQNQELQQRLQSHGSGNIQLAYRQTQSQLATERNSNDKLRKERDQALDAYQKLTDQHRRPKEIINNVLQAHSHSDLHHANSRTNPTPMSAPSGPRTESAPSPSTGSKVTTKPLLNQSPLGPVRHSQAQVQWDQQAPQYQPAQHQQAHHPLPQYPSPQQHLAQQFLFQHLQHLQGQYQQPLNQQFPYQQSPDQNRQYSLAQCTTGQDPFNQGQPSPYPPLVPAQQVQRIPCQVADAGAQAPYSSSHFYPNTSNQSDISRAVNAQNFALSNSMSPGNQIQVQRQETQSLPTDHVRQGQTRDQEAENLYLRSREIQLQQARTQDATIGRVQAAQGRAITIQGRDDEVEILEVRTLSATPSPDEQARKARSDFANKGLIWMAGQHHPGRIGTNDPTNFGGVPVVSPKDKQYTPAELQNLIAEHEALAQTSIPDSAPAESRKKRAITKKPANMLDLADMVGLEKAQREKKKASNKKYRERKKAQKKHDQVHRETRSPASASSSPAPTPLNRNQEPENSEGPLWPSHWNHMPEAQFEEDDVAWFERWLIEDEEMHVDLLEETPEDAEGNQEEEDAGTQEHGREV